MKVSIVMLVYNHERFIRQALDSVFMQKTDFDYELIIGEDCSTDHTRSIIQEYEKKFANKMHTVYRNTNVGIIKNLLDCLRRCTGEYIAFLEGDDYWTDERKLQKTVHFLELHPQYSAAAHNYNIVDLTDHFIRNGLEYDTLFEYDKREFEKYRLPSQTSTLCIRNLISKLTKKDLLKILKYRWIPGDRLFVLLLLQYGKIAVLPDIMSTYRRYIEAGGTNWTSRYDIAAVQNYSYVFKIMCGMERLSHSYGEPLDMLSARITLVRKAIKARRWSEHKWKLYLQYAHMLLIERHKIRFLKELKKSFDSYR